MPFLLLVVCLGAAFGPAAAQSVTETRLKPAVRIPRAQEIALARHAAPAAIAERSAVWVLGERGYETAAEGSNGYGCIVQRGTNGQSLIPRCDEASGVAALFPLFFLLEEMRAQGASVEAYRKAVGEGYRTGRLKTPRFGGLSYMYSTDAYFITDSGQRVAFTPHVMIYWPNCSAQDLGVPTLEDARGTHVSLLDPGSPECHLIINTPPETARKMTSQP